MHDTFNSGNGRIAEIVSKWLFKLGTTSKSLASSLDGFQETKELTLTSKCAEFFPKSGKIGNKPLYLILYLAFAWSE